MFIQILWQKNGVRFDRGSVFSSTGERIFVTEMKADFQLTRVLSYQSALLKLTDGS